jgi:XapX domain-containing protein
MTWRKTVRPPLIAFGVGLGMGIVYWLIRVPSPAPAPIALIGLLGMIIGEVVVSCLLERVRTRSARGATPIDPVDVAAPASEHRGAAQ